MAEDKIICETNGIYYSTIRKAMVAGARSIDEIVKISGACNACGGCRDKLQAIATSVCGCLEVSLKDVVDAVKNGADTVEKVGLKTKAGTGKDCGRCKVLIENIIELGR